MNKINFVARCWRPKPTVQTARLWLLVATIATAFMLLTVNVHAADSTPAQRTAFDHLTTGFELVGQHRDLPCESCHVNAIFKGTPRDCAACHGVGTAVRATAKPVTHVLTSNVCSACHTPVGWSPAVNFDHAEVMGSCYTCHNGVQAQGKGPNHIDTNMDCGVCHSTIGWAGAVFNHVGTKSGCATCHNGLGATGQPANHVPTIPAGDGTCEGCHSPTNYTTWKDVISTAAVHTSAAGWACASCHETATFLGMIASTASAAHDSRPPAAFDANHPGVAAGDCGICHDTVSFTALTSLRPANHIPTNAPCLQCHLTPGLYTQYSVAGTHVGVTECLSCHGSTVGPFANVTIVNATSTNHIPFGTLDCNGSGCHSTSNVTPGGFKIGTGVGNINAPTLTVAGHTTVAGQVPACTTCHEAAAYQGMMAGTGTTAGDSRPSAIFDVAHPATGDCVQCHTTTPVFATNLSASGTKPANHIPTNAPCVQCHTVAGDFKSYSVTGTHIGVTECLSCHAPTVASTFVGVTIISTAGNHIPIGALDCNGSGCHGTTNVNPGGFKLGAGMVGSINNPTLNIAGHTTVGAEVAACSTCHETAAFQGMVVGSGAAAGDSRPLAALDATHPATGDCVTCHTTTPVFASDLTATTGLPAGHIPTTAPCVQCHTTAGNYKVYSVTGTHQGVTECLSCHAANVAATFLNVTITPLSSNHIPVGNLDCSGSGCHTTANVNPGGFKIGTGVANITTPTLNIAGHATVAGQVPACSTCHEAASFQGMVATTAVPPGGDSRPSTTLDSLHPTTGDCGNCHTSTPTFTNDLLPQNVPKPANHIPTNATCGQCHTTAGDFKQYSVVGTHKGVTGCLACHGTGVGPFANITIVAAASTNHFPIGTLDCNGSGCHSLSNVNPGGFLMGAANIKTPTLNVAGHTTVAGQVPACTSCHDTAAYTGMVATVNATGGDSRPSTAIDSLHPTAGDCSSSNCHTSTAPTFASNLGAGSKPANHIPTTAPCTQCHTTPGNFKLYSVVGTHQGVTTCLGCHGPTVGPFVNITLVTSASTNHFPFGTLDCNGSGCHSISNVNPGGFKVGTANINAPTLTVAGHTTVKGQVPACTSCHESAAFTGMIATTAMPGADSRPSTAVDASHPTAGDCGGTCHTTSAPTFASNVGAGSKPSNHIPTTAACTLCHTTAGNYTLYSVVGTHQGVTTCLSCHGPKVGPFANVTMVTSASTNHFPFGTLDCNGSGCHSISNVNPGGFKLGAANINSPTLTVAGHTTVKGQVPACNSCHESAAFTGMIASTSTLAADSRPTAFDKAHPTSGDCGGACHTTTAPTFSSNYNGTAKPPNHIPTTQACSVCHTTAGNFAVAVMGATGHAGISSGCKTCHSYGQVFAGVWAGAATGPVAPPAGASGHIPTNPPNTSARDIACESCHSVSNFATFAGTVMRHAFVTTMQCMACHELGMSWKTNTGVRLWQRDSANHYPGIDCTTGCHQHSAKDRHVLRRVATAAPVERASTAAAGVAALGGGALGRGGVFDHRRVAATACVSCHSVASGTGKTIDHIATSNNCANCHSTVAWLPATQVDHTQVIGTCVSCHNGTVAKGKGNNHVTSGSTCETCHTTVAWTPARFDHAGIAPGSCTTCHDGLHAIGLPGNHVPTSAQCDTCHGTLGWKPAKLDHAKLISNCASCHNNAIALGVPPAHMSSKVDCATCHSYPDWSVLRFVHTSARYPGDHKVALTCTSCHTTNTDQIPWLAPAGAGTCAGCHTKDYVPVKHPKTVSGLLYTVSELGECTGACHVYSDTSLKTVSKSLPGPYHRVSDAAFKH